MKNKRFVILLCLSLLCGLLTGCGAAATNARAARPPANAWPAGRAANACPVHWES